MKRITALILSVLLLLSVLPLTAFAANATKGKCGENLTWSINTSTGVLKIKGKGKMTDYESGISNTAAAPWKKNYSSKIKSVEIASGVTSIGKYAFYGCSSLKKVSIPNTVRSVGSYAFANCYSLKYNNYNNGKYLGNDKNPYLYFARLNDITASEYVIHEDTKFIGNDAFYFRIELTKVYIPNGVLSIGSDAFNKCLKLTDAVLPQTLKKIEHNAFAGCSSLSSVIIPMSVKSVASTAFDYNCEINYVGTRKQWKKICLNSNSNIVNYSYKETYSSDFSDVPVGAWYETSVKYCAQKGYVGGVGDGIFNPLGELTREQFIQILFNFAGQKSENWCGKTGFDDVDEGQWYSPAIKWANDNGVTKGVGQGRFGLGVKITREQFATLLMNYTKHLGIKTSKKADLSIYKDLKEVSDWALPAMKWAVAEKLLSGTSKETLSPQMTANRATATMIFMNYSKNIAK